jgi:hypothetical protein
MWSGFFYGNIDEEANCVYNNSLVSLLNSFFVVFFSLLI